MKVYKYILLSIELKLYELQYNMMLIDPIRHLEHMLDVRIKIEELRTKINEL